MTVRISESIEAEICRMFVDGVPFKAINDRFGLNQATIYRILRRCGIPCRRTLFNLDDEHRDTIVRRYIAGESSLSLSREFHIVERSVTKLIKQAGLQIRTPIEVHRLRNPGLREDAFDTITEESAYWIGFLMTDGCISDSEKYQKRIQLVLGPEDREHVERFRSFIGTSREVKECKTSHVRKDGHRCMSFGISVSSDRIARALASYGVVPRKTLITKVIGLENNRDFWRGVIDGDGNLGFSNKTYPNPCPRLQLTGTKTLLNQFVSYCNQVTNVGQPPIKQPIGNRAYVVTLHGIKARTIVYELYNWATISLPRKQVIAEQVFT